MIDFRPGNPLAGEPPLPRFILERAGKRAADDKPGCKAADEALLVSKHLEGLAKGWGGFGLLRLSKQRLEDAAVSARRAGESELADALQAIADKLPSVHDEQEAHGVLNELEQLLPQAWSLGQRCGKTSAAMKKAELALGLLEAHP